MKYANLSIFLSIDEASSILVSCRRHSSHYYSRRLFSSTVEWTPSLENYYCPWYHLICRKITAVLWRAWRQTYFPLYST